MATVLTLIGKRPGQQQFGLDTFTESYKCDATADAVLTDNTVRQMGSAHPDYEFMFITARPCSETGEKASVLDLIYTGCLTDDGEGNPNLPTQQHSGGNDVMSAQSSRSVSGVILSSPLSVQFYSPTENLSYVSYNSRGSTNAGTPSAAIQPITLATGDVTFTGGGLVALFFVEQVISTIQSNEVVAGHFWINTAVTKKVLSPFVFNLPTGPYVVCVSVGTSYIVGDTLTISGGGGAAVIDLTNVGTAGSVAGWTQTANTCTFDDTNISASGGSGSGAVFDIVVP